MYSIIHELHNYLHVLVINPFPQNLSVLAETPFSRESDIITKSFVQLAPDSATKSVPIKVSIKIKRRDKVFFNCVLQRMY